MREYEDSFSRWYNVQCEFDAEDWKLEIAKPTWMAACNQHAARWVPVEKALPDKDGVYLCLGYWNRMDFKSKKLSAREDIFKKKNGGTVGKFYGQVRYWLDNVPPIPQIPTSGITVPDEEEI